MTLSKVMFYLIHLAFAIRTFLWGLIASLSKTLTLKPHKQTLNSAREDSKCLPKLPGHLAFVVVEENISYSDLAKLLIWSAAMGITCITMYDKLGFIKNNKPRLEVSIEEQLESSEKKKYHFDINVGCTRKDHSQGSNGTRHIDVFLLSVKEGRQRLVETTRWLARSVTSNQYRQEHITPCNIDAILQEGQGFPDPDLVLRFGSTESLLGYMPWQIRLTEILSLPTHHNIDYSSFHRLLVSYGHSEQRFGK